MASPLLRDLNSLFPGDARFAADAGVRIDQNTNRVLEPAERRTAVQLARTPGRDDQYIASKLRGLYEHRIGAGALDHDDATSKLDRWLKIESALRGINKSRMKRDLIRLCTDPEFDQRWSASPKYNNVVNFVAGELERAGCQPFGETIDGRRTFFDTFKYEQRFGNDSRAMSETKNVYALFPGTEPDPSKRKKLLVVAHLDGISEAEIADYGVGPGKRFEAHVHQGANDNAAAVVAAMEFARFLKNIGGFKHDVVFWFPAAEEDGLLGTEAALKPPPFPLDDVIGGFGLEMIGRNATEEMFVIGGETEREIASNEFYTRVFRVADHTGIKVQPGLPIERDPEDWCIRSDWEVLRNAGINVAGIFGGADPGTYHTPDDTWEKINLDKVRQVVRLMAHTFREVDDDQAIEEKNEPMQPDLNPHFTGRVDNT